MAELLPLNADELLSTTRAVRKRLDLDRPVPPAVVREALQVALQAPSGGNRQGWHWIVLTGDEPRKRIAELYARSYREVYGPAAEATGSLDPARARMLSSSTYLAEIMHRVPVLVIGAIRVGGSGLPEGNQAGLWGSLLPAAWSLALALRARGLGTAWTSLHLRYEREAAEILGIPANIRQGVLLPVAYTVGTDFRPGPRADLDEVLHVDHW
jgi:nitroreductase